MTTTELYEHYCHEAARLYDIANDPARSEDEREQARQAMKWADAECDRLEALEATR